MAEIFFKKLEICSQPTITLLCLLVGKDGKGGGGQIAFFEIFDPQKHSIMTHPPKLRTPF